MHRNEAKIVIVVASILMLIWSMSVYFLPFVSFLVDDEFQDAVARAAQIWIETETINNRPFGHITRAQATDRYNKTAEYRNMPIYSDDICVFNDIDDIDQNILTNIMLACQYRFFWGSQWAFAPDAYLTKSSSLVAITKGMYPREEFVGMLPYREPFVERAYDNGITKYHSTEYLERLITKYELLLELYRLGKIEG